MNQKESSLRHTQSHSPSHYPELQHYHKPWEANYWVDPWKEYNKHTAKEDCPRKVGSKLLLIWWLQPNMTFSSVLSRNQGKRESHEGVHRSQWVIKRKITLSRKMLHLSLSYKISYKDKEKYGKDFSYRFPREGRRWGRSFYLTFGCSTGTFLRASEGTAMGTKLTEQSFLSPEERQHWSSSWALLPSQSPSHFSTFNNSKSRPASPDEHQPADFSRKSMIHTHVYLHAENESQDIYNINGPSFLSLSYITPS